MPFGKSFEYHWIPFPKEIRKFLGGNPAAVCLLEEDVSDDLKQKIAEEMKLSETAFVVPQDKTLAFDKGTKFALRWFTPTTEVPLCGHATLASAAVLFYTQGNENVSHFIQISI